MKRITFGARHVMAHGGSSPLSRAATRPKGVRRRRLIVALSVLLVSSFVAGDLVAADVVAAVPAQEPPGQREGLVVDKGDGDAEAGRLPALPSTPAERPADPTGDFSFPVGGPKPPGWKSPRATGFVEGQSVEVVDLTTETKQVFENPDGSFTEELSPSPVRYRDASGTWRDYDQDLKASNGGFVPEAAPAGERVAATADSAAVVSTVTDAGVVKLEQPDAEAVPGVVEGNEVVYADAVDGDADLVVKLLPTGFETTVVVPDGSPERASFAQTLSAPMAQELPMTRPRTRPTHRYSPSS